MGIPGSSLQTRCVYGCATHGASCAPGDAYDGWVTQEVNKAISSQDVKRVQELVDQAPGVKDRAFNFAGEDVPMTVLAFVLRRRDARIVRALLAAGVSPNLPISDAQKSIYEQRSKLAALNGGDADLQHMVPTTHFEALCAVQHKDMFNLLLESSANPNGGIIQVCHCGDADMLDAVLRHGAEPNCWQRGSTPLISAVKSKLEPHKKATCLLRAAADPNFIGSGGLAFAADHAQNGFVPCPPLVFATRKRDYRMVKLLLESGADANQMVEEEGLPNALFWATYWGELELVKLFATVSKHRLDLDRKKYTGETVVDVAETSKSFTKMKKPKHISKLPLPSRPPVVYDKILQVLEEYRSQHVEPEVTSQGTFTASTVATRRDMAAAIAEAV